MNSYNTPARTYFKGIGDAVADRTINRLVPDLAAKIDGSAVRLTPNDTFPVRREIWAEVAERVAQGNASLAPADDFDFEFHPLHHHLREASILMSGRHLQHGDLTQPTRNQEVFTNCSTAAVSFLLFYLLLNGSGVGRCYDDDMMIVDWAGKMPNVVPIIRGDHPDVISGEIGREFVEAILDVDSTKTIVYEVPDSREGWAKAVEQIERLTWEGVHADSTLLIDFSLVRPRGAPIGGMQGRPASGPGPLMQAIKQIASLKGNGMAPWMSTMYVDHFLAECVLVGGARRAARMATKTWRDKSVLEFVSVKKGGVLWSSNNSVMVDAEFWNYAKGDVGARGKETTAAHAREVFEAICSASYHDGTGEPGLINADKLARNDRGIETQFDGDYARSSRFQVDNETLAMTGELARVFASLPFNMIVNPCGEIALSLLGGYCVIADVVPYFAGTVDDLEDWDRNAEQAFRTAARALIRVNTMDCLYGKEVRRTNRIGVGFTGIHEYAWVRFGLGFRDMLDEHGKGAPFWKMMARFSNATVDEAIQYSVQLGVNIPHTVTTVKPAGTTSKLFGLTEGAHLPSMREYLRWVQFRSDDPLIEQYRAKGYPVRALKSYSGTTIVGFPTVPEICKLGMGDALVTAAEATPEEQYEYLRLLEKYWLHGSRPVYGGMAAEGGPAHTGPLFDDVQHAYGNQVSYTLKYDPKTVGYAEFRRTLLEGQSSIKCCSVMPQSDATAYEYQPEEPVSAERFQQILAGINDSAVREEVGFEHVDCAGGACPVDFLGSER